MNPRPHQPMKMSSLLNTTTIIITTTITTASIADMGRWWSYPDIAVIIITIITITASIPAIEVAGSGLAIKQDLRVLFFCVPPGLDWG